MSKLENMHCLVTGGAGFIGSHLVDTLLDRGARVRVLDNLVNGKPANLTQHEENSRYSFMLGSITDPLDVEKAMASIDVVFHLACLGVRHSITHPYANHLVNSEGTLLLLDAAHRRKVSRFIHCSSSEVYGTARTVPMKEEHPTLPCTIYGASKLAGEAYTRAYHTTYGLNAAIIRPFNTYGPRSHHEGDAGEMIPKSIVRALAGKEILIFGDGSQTRDFTYVEDTARGLAAAAECDAVIGKTLNIGSDFEISIVKLAEKLLEMVNNPQARIVHTPDRPGDVGRLWADASEFVKLTSWQPQTNFNDGLTETISFFRDHSSDINTLIRSETGRNWEGVIPE